MNNCIFRTIFNSKTKLYNLNSCKYKLINDEQSKNNIARKSYCRQNNSAVKLTGNENLDQVNSNEHNLSTSFLGKYKIFRDEDAPIIFDVSEERKKIELGELNIYNESDPYEGLNLSHGVNGVFDIEDLVELLQRDKARQVFVASVPKEYSYVDYIVITTGRTPKHMYAVAASVRKMFKMKMYKNDIIPKIEGEKSTEWIALDLGNIALHIFSYEARIKYDLETLWTVGSAYDDISNKQDSELHIMDKYKNFLKELQPAE